jgi:hypothetical protein
MVVLAILAAALPASALPLNAPAKPKPLKEEADAAAACVKILTEGFRPIAKTRDVRFEGKVKEANALCRGGYQAEQFRLTPWVDWSNYWGTGDMDSLPKGFLTAKLPTLRGVNGALLVLEYQRIELIKFNLFDNAGTYRQYVNGRNDRTGPTLKVWPEMRLPRTDPNFSRLQVDPSSGDQVCTGDLVRGRTLTGICNDVKNPLMGSNGTPFARNVEFETSFPELGANELTANRHGGRLSLLQPDPQVISRTLFTRPQPAGNNCNAGFGTPDNSVSSDCDYQKAPFFNVLAAYWIQFMTHDWFSHMEDGHNATEYMDVGCRTKLVQGQEVPLTQEEITELGCRPGDKVDTAYVLDSSTPESFTFNGKQYLARAPKTFSNNADLRLR